MEMLSHLRRSIHIKVETTKHIQGLDLEDCLDKGNSNYAGKSICHHVSEQSKTMVGKQR